MTDPWARPSDDGAPARRAPAQPIEIELDGHGTSETDEHDHGSDGDEPNWRVVAGTAAVLGVVLGLVIAGVAVWTDDDDDRPPTTTIPVDELATEITAPPTLPPVETTPPTTIGGLERMVDEPRPVTVPTYPPDPLEPAESPWPEVPLTFADLDESLVATITSDSAFADQPSDGRLLWDAANRRFELRFDLPVGTSRTIYDVVTEAVYEAIERPRSGAPVWTRTPAASFFPSGVDPGEYFERILLGPVRADNVDQAVLATREALTRTVNGVPTRRTTFEMPESAVVPWGAADGTLRLTYDVFADREGRVVLTQGLNTPGGSPVALVHAVRAIDVTVALPDEDDVADATSGGDSGVLPAAVTPEALRPNYETVDPVPATSTGPFSITEALADMRDRPPAAATVDVLSDTSTIWFTAQRDDRSDRRLMTRSIVEPLAVDTVQIDDAATAATYVTDDVDGTWTRLSSTGPGGRLPPVDERLVSGLASPTAIEEAKVLAFYRYVVLPDGTTALEAHLGVEPGVIVLPTILPMRLDPTQPVDLYVYVESGRVRELQVLSNHGGPALAVQRFDADVAPAITLPPERRVADG